MCRGLSMWIAPRRSVLLLTCSALSMCICVFRIQAKRKDEFFILRLQDPRGRLHCGTQGNRKWAHMQLCAAAPEGKAAYQQLCGAVTCHPAVSMHHRRACFFVALLQLFQQVAMSQPSPTPKKPSYSCRWAALSEQLMKCFIYLKCKGIKAIIFLWEFIRKLPMITGTFKSPKSNSQIEITGESLALKIISGFPIFQMGM